MNRGFSLAEVIIVVALVASVVLVVGNFSININGLDTLVSSELQGRSTVDQSLQMMTSAIQSAETSANGAYPVDSVGTSSFAFYADVNQNGVAEHVRYFYATSTLYQGIIQPTGTPPTYPTSSEVITDLVDNVIITSSTPLFSYYGSSYTGSGPALVAPVAVSTVRLVGISFETQSLQVATSERPPIQYFSKLVDLRNLDSN